MTTIVIHGTLAMGSSWYWNSWGERGFCRVLAEAMTRVSGSHDVWRVKGKPVGEIPELNPKRKADARVEADKGVFYWTGAPDGMSRGLGAQALVQYLNVLRKLTGEPLRIVAHSHGCNVVKLASGLPELSPDVYIAKAVFLACPHFWEDDYVFEEPKGLDKFDIRKVGPKAKGRKYRYRVSPQRFGKILNLYSERDDVQKELAETWSGGSVPQTGTLLENMGRMLNTGEIIEAPHGEREDSDPEAQSLYENHKVKVSAAVDGIHAHSALHGAIAAMLAGVWLDLDTTVQALEAEHGPIPEVEAGDECA